jgi:hypothetical protein
MRQAAVSAWFLGAALSAGLAAPAVAQEEPVTRVDDIVVIGNVPLREQIDIFVGEVTEPPEGRGPARWSRRGGVCVGVANLRQDVAQAVADRVSDRARQLGLTVGEPGCRANVLIIATDDGQALARALVERSPNAFRPDYAGSSKTRRELDLFVETDRPIRWWHVSMPVISGQGIPAVRMPGEDAPFIPGSGRVRTAVRNVLLRAYVIVDLNQTEHLTLNQLADYAAMVAFAQIDPDAEVDQFSTILNVLDDPGAVSELTDWDLAYLGAVYTGERNQRSPRSQVSSVAASMYADRDAAMEEEAPGAE